LQPRLPRNGTISNTGRAIPHSRLWIAAFSAGGNSPFDWAALSRGPSGEELLNQVWLVYEPMHWPSEARLDDSFSRLLVDRHPETYWEDKKAIEKLNAELRGSGEQMGRALMNCAGLLWPEAVFHTPGIAERAGIGCCREWSRAFSHATGKCLQLNCLQSLIGISAGRQAQFFRLTLHNEHVNRCRNNQQSEPPAALQPRTHTRKFHQIQQKRTKPKIP